jgi:hypothetical protein
MACSDEEVTGSFPTCACPVLRWANGIYDIITVDDGLGGSSLVKAMTERGARVLVLERETQFKDGWVVRTWSPGES